MLEISQMCAALKAAFLVSGDAFISFSGIVVLHLTQVGFIQPMFFQVSWILLHGRFLILRLCGFGEILPMC